MEVAGQWRRQWAGSAEYGKVTEGGVTRQVARAMEVLHASGPGAAVRVVRAAYHSSAGPGAPAASYLVQSSRRVFSSGFNFLEPPSFPSKPLEISTTPFDSNESSNENTAYKVTEPDDTEISEPSKWRGSTAGTNSIRLPSEESSSTDNASIIDLDRRSRTSPRKSSCDSESSELQFPKRNSIDIPIQLSSPVALSTLKYKSLLNNNNDWNDRRQSYSFEDASPTHDKNHHAKETLAMESSTDSGICKSSELVNEPTDGKYNLKSYEDKNAKDISFKDWLSRNRNYPHDRLSPDIKHESKLENNVSLRSSGKVSITVPITIEKDEKPINNHSSTNEDVDRRVKRVEFCKTELHFAAESGKVNIIATDEKPPPSNDFRKRRSAFVPLNENFERPVTLFGEKGLNNSLSNNNPLNTSHNHELTESIESTAATKSILKNKIPKPKPYLLGENMEFGLLDNVTNKENKTEDFVVPSAVLLINKQLQEGRNSKEDFTTDVTNDNAKFNHDFNTRRTINQGSLRNEFTSYLSTHTKERSIDIPHKDERKLRRSPSPSKNKIRTSAISPTTKESRALRDSDLVYFGVGQKQNTKNQKQNYTETRLPFERGNEFKSVKLIQKVSNSVCNSDNESENQNEYENLPLKPKFTPVPAPRTSVLLEKPQEVVEEEYISKKIYETRRSRFRGQDIGGSSRSISEPPKQKPNHRTNKNPGVNNERYRNPEVSRNKNDIIYEIEDTNSNSDSAPSYVNLRANDLQDQIISTPDIRRKKVFANANTLSGTQDRIKKTKTNNLSGAESSSTFHVSDKSTKSRHSPDRQSIRRSRHRTEKLQTPDITNESKELGGSIKYRKSKREESDTSLMKERDEVCIKPIEVLPTAKHREHREKRSKSCNNNKDSLRSISSVPNKNEFTVYKPVNNIKNAHDNATSRSNESIQRSKADKYRTEKKDDTVSKTKITKQHDKTAATKGYDTKNEKSRSYKKSEYVINYDDKNGTVSSVCKIRPNSASSKMSKVHRESKDKPKSSDRISLLQLLERDGTQNDYDRVDRRSYRKMRMHRTCQLL